MDKQVLLKWENSNSLIPTLFPDPYLKREQGLQGHSLCSEDNPLVQAEVLGGAFADMMRRLQAQSGQQFQGGGYARGAGSGRDDTIEALLSDGEYVMDAETVSLLGDGSNDAGAARLDEMREELRRHKGRELSKGKFSPDARRPMQYLKRGGPARSRYKKGGRVGSNKRIARAMAQAAKGEK
jgi:hypothetical protein